MTHAPSSGLWMFLGNLERPGFEVVVEQPPEHFVKVALVVHVLEAVKSEPHLFQQGRLLIRQFILEMQPSKRFASLAVGIAQGNVAIAILFLVRHEGRIDLRQDRRHDGGGEFGRLLRVARR